MSDSFAYSAAGPESPGVRHTQITPSDTVPITRRPRSIYCQVAGTCVVVDAHGTALSYTMTQGQILPFRGVRINLTGTTGTYYGWS